MSDDITPPDFGVDFLCLEDLEDDLRTVTGVDVAKQDVFHRLTTEALINDPEFGINVRDYIGQGYTSETIQSIAPAIDSAAQRSQYVDSSETTITIEQGSDTNEETITLSLTCFTALGPFDLVMSVTKVTVDIL